MAIYADMHVHTTFSSDGKGSMDEMIQKALSLGLRHICFTEHNDFDYPRHERDPENIFLLNVDSYLYELLTKREKYGDRINRAWRGSCDRTEKYSTQPIARF